MRADKNRIAPSKRLGPSKRDIQRRNAAKTQHSTPPPPGLPPGKDGRVEHMRAHAMAYLTVGGPKDPEGLWLWKMADVLDKGIATPKNGAPAGEPKRTQEVIP